MIAMVAADRDLAADRLDRRALARSSKYAAVAAAMLMAGDGRDVPQERADRADLGLPHDRVLPPARAAQARAARDRAHPHRPGALTGRADRGARPARPQPARRHHGERPDGRLRRDPSRPVDAPAFGRGYGSYEHTSYRILDMELLRQIIEVGRARADRVRRSWPSPSSRWRAARSARARPDAPVALAVAASAVCFLVVSTLFDVMSFPHVPYIFLWMAALLAVIMAQPQGVPRARARARAAGGQRLPELEPAWSS